MNLGFNNLMFGFGEVRLNSVNFVGKVVGASSLGLETNRRTHSFVKRNFHEGLEILGVQNTVQRHSTLCGHKYLTVPLLFGFRNIRRINPFATDCVVRGDGNGATAAVRHDREDLPRRYARPRRLAMRSQSAGYVALRYVTLRSTSPIYLCRLGRPAARPRRLNYANEPQNHDIRSFVHKIAL